MGIYKKHLPSHLIYGILLRLQPKSLIRFKAVSKKWKALIEDPSFIKSHLQQATTRADFNFLLITSKSDQRNILSLVNVETLQGLVEYKFPWDISLVGSCKGLTCFLNPVGDMFVWNMAIKDCHQIPEEHLLAATYGFGYDAISDDYKVVKIFQVLGLICYTKVYSMKSGAWKRVENSPHYLWNQFEPGVHVSGALHWSAVETYSEKEVILSFDLRTETYRGVPLPDHGTLELKKITLGVLEGCLCVTERRNISFKFDTWMLKEHSWTKIFSFTLYENSLVRPLSYSRKGDEILLQCKSNRIYWHQLKKKDAVKNHRGLKHICKSEICLSTIVPVSNHPRELETRRRKRRGQGESKQKRRLK